jgi:hypothetical protein
LFSVSFIFTYLYFVGNIFQDKFGVINLDASILQYRLRGKIWNSVTGIKPKNSTSKLLNYVYMADLEHLTL